MYKIFVILSAVVALALAAPQQTKQIAATIEKVVNSQNGQLSIPPDNGGNYGDNIWGIKSDTDRLLLRQVVINTIEKQDYEWVWKATSTGYYITHIRFLNIGRERSYVGAVTCTDHKNIVAYLDIFANQQFRVLVEVYGH